jgi:hypothetical protein
MKHKRGWRGSVRSRPGPRVCAPAAPPGVPLVPAGAAAASHPAASLRTYTAGPAAPRGRRRQTPPPAWGGPPPPPPPPPGGGGGAPPPPRPPQRAHGGRGERASPRHLSARPIASPRFSPLLHSGARRRASHRSRGGGDPAVLPRGDRCPSRTRVARAASYLSKVCERDEAQVLR